ncbi:hypothetical protein EJ02DRAFT_514213 [Clathrospora elynae]|uniref:GPI anchored serine-rich protein n=1 Tax=Clathrospora elynae TaxID=706981 RepID=A0A6A5SGJ3_9PLEO|nr:hypothetical protein EJ02DRAFT_514213 [Clathrospora elynae]
MRFTIIAASLVAAVAAHYGVPTEESCGALVTVTVTATLAHTPVAPSSLAPYYPTTTPAVVVPVVPTGTGVPAVPEVSTVGGTGVPVASGTAAPSGTGSATAPYPLFTGAASSLKIGGALAGVGAVAAFFL